MRKLINIKHHIDDYECMWNGIEDIYMEKTNSIIPLQMFFSLCSMGSFAYIKTNKADIKRMISFGEGRTKKMYEFLAPIVGFDYHFIECKTPQIALLKAKKEIDEGYPVVLGALDMFYLDYFKKLYHKEHIPFHYILMIGYDDEKKEIYFNDCGREGITKLSYDNLILAWNASYPGLCKPNTICQIRMDKPNDLKDIIKKVWSIKTDLFLNPPVSFLGVKGIQKLAKELPDLEEEIGKEETIKVLKNTVSFFGSVPTMPNKLLKIEEADDVLFMCSREKHSKLLLDLSKIYQNEKLSIASELLYRSGKEFEKLTQIFIDYILGIKKDLNEAREIILNIGNIEKDAYSLIKDTINEI